MPDAACVDASPPDLSQKRLRNRLSQAAFRKRQSAYIKDLERRLEIRGNDDNEQITRLEKDNAALRTQLTATFNKLESVQVTLRSLSASIMSQISPGSAVDLLTPEEPLPGSPPENEQHHQPVNNLATRDVASTQDLVGTGTNMPSDPALPGPLIDKEDDYDATNSDTTRDKPPTQEPPLTTISNDTDHRPAEYPVPDSNSDDGLLFSTALPDTVTAPNCEMGEPVINTSSSVGSAGRGCQVPLDVDISHLLDRFVDMRSLPGVWTHEYQMGPASFHAKTIGANNTSRNIVNTNSSFSDHMHLIRASLAKKWQSASQCRSRAPTSDGLRLSTTVMISLFHSLNRPAALTWYTATRFQDNVTNLLIWQMNHSRVAYSRLHANYRPSALQLIEKYPSVIDWCPFPTVRDKLILLHSANPYLDQVICDIATAYVVEVDADDLILGQVGRGYIRIWDLITAFEGDNGGSGDSINQDSNSGPIPECLPTSEFGGGHFPFFLPAPDIECLFVPQYAREAFRVLGLDDGVPRFKLDPSLFVQYPELYDSGVDIIAMGTAIAPKVQTKLPGPALPKQETRFIYQNFAEWCVDAICNTSLMEGYQNV